MFDLLLDYPVLEGERVKWDTLLELAGHANYQPAHELLESLLRGGWAQLEDRRKERRCQPLWISWLLTQLKQLRWWNGICPPISKSKIWLCVDIHEKGKVLFSKTSQLTLRFLATFSL
ncbi:MAG: hypothetical protein ACREXY_19510 [Gammaproteobacteria bacterium]